MHSKELQSKERFLFYHYFDIQILQLLLYSQENHLPLMKKYYFLILYFTIQFVFAQDFVTETSRIAESEMKSASQLMNFQVNPNTANYDVTYHKLEFTVNPAVYAIAGKVTTTFKALSNMTTVTFDLTDQLTVSSVNKAQPI